MTRLKDIAQIAGVSIKTVSRVINKHPDVNEDTRGRILQLVKETSYMPHLGARGLRLNKTYTIGFVFPQITNEFFLEVALSLGQTAHEKNYSVIMSSTKETYESEIESVQVLLSKRVDGIVIVSVGTTGNFLKSVAERQNVPIVLVGNRVPGLLASSVLQDNARGAHMLATHLIEHGHSRIAYVTGPLRNSSSQDRLEGFRSALREKGISLRPDFVKASDWSFEGGYSATLELIRKGKDRPTAIFYANANTAIGALRAMRKASLKVPDDVAIVSFENISMLDNLDPPLTSLNKVGEKIGGLAFDLLQRSMSTRQGPTTNPTERLVKANLCIRESCGCSRNS